jgi:hypothetical protein
VTGGAAAAAILGLSGLCTERLPAAARGHCVGVFDLEPAPHEAIDVIDISSGNVLDTAWVHNHAKAALLEHNIDITRIIIERHTILHTTASPAGYKYAQAICIGQVFSAMMFRNFSAADSVSVTTAVCSDVTTVIGIPP